MKKYNTLLLFLFITIIVLSVVRIAVSNAFATDGIALSTFQNEVDRYQKENMILREEYYSNASLTHIASAAASLGFVPDNSTLFLGNLPVALKQ